MMRQKHYVWFSSDGVHWKNFECPNSHEAYRVASRLKTKYKYVQYKAGLKY